MAIVVGITDFTILADGHVKVAWEDGRTSTYTDLTEMKASVATIETRENAEMFLLGWFLARSADANNVNLVEGKNLTLDLSAANMIRVQ